MKQKDKSSFETDQTEKLDCAPENNVFVEKVQCIDHTGD